MQSTFELLNKITKKKRSQAEVLKYLQKHDKKLHDKIKGCASYLLIREFIESGETRIRNANFCKRFQICPACAVRRGAKLAEAGLEKVQHVMASESPLTPVMITLGVPNSKNVEEGLGQLKGALSAMMAKRRKAIAGNRGHNPIEFCKVQGGIKSMEVTNKGKGWHPHVHIFALINDWIDREKLRDEFVSFGGGKIVDVRTITAKETREDQTDEEAKEQALISGLLEVLKYPTKFGDLTPKQRHEFYVGARSTRLTDCFGNLRGVKIGDIDNDDIELEGAFRDWVARWYHRQQGFRLYPANAWDDPEEDKEVPIPEPQ